MEDLFEMEQEKEHVKNNRLHMQQYNKDYSYEEDGSIEKCKDCGSFINSHGHCPVCDY